MSTRHAALTGPPQQHTGLVPDGSLHGNWVVAGNILLPGTFRQTPPPIPVDGQAPQRGDGV